MMAANIFIRRIPLAIFTHTKVSEYTNKLGKTRKPTHVHGSIKGAKLAAAEQGAK